MAVMFAAAIASAATWDAGGGADTSMINADNWSAAFTSTGSSGGTNYYGYNNQHADINGDYDVTLGSGEWFRQDTSIAGYQTRMYNPLNTLTIENGGRLTAGAALTLAGGSIVQNGGLVEAGSMSLSYGAATASSYTLNNGTLAISGALIAQPTGTTNCSITVNGGTMTVGTDSYLRARSDGHASTFNVSGGDVTFSGALHLGLNGWGATQGDNTINLNSGTLRVNGGLLGDVDKADSQIVNFNGGTLATKSVAAGAVFGTTVQKWNVNSASTFELEDGAVQNVTVSPNVVLNDANLTFKNSDSDNLMVMAGSAWTGTGGLAFEGANTDAARFQFQSAINTFSGGATINSGYVRLNAGTTYGTEVTAGGLGTGTITFGNQGDSTLLLNYTSGDAQNGIQVDAGSYENTVIVSSARSANMSLAFGGGINTDGDLTIDNQGSGIVVAGAATGNGNLILKDGIYQMQTTGNTVGGVTVQNGAELRHGVENGLGTGTAVTVESGGTWNIGGRNQQAGSIAGGGTINIQGNRNLNFGYDNTDTEFSGTIALGAGTGAAFGKYGTGTTTLSGDNGFVNHVNVLGGTLKLGHANALGSTDGFNVVWSGATMDVNGQAIAGEKVFLRDGGTGGLLNSSASAASWSGEIINDGESGSIGGSGDITISGAIKSSDPLTIEEGQSKTLVKIGAGKVTLTGDNSGFFNNVTVSEGTLAVNSNLGTGGGLITISGGTLGGTGTVGSVLVSSGLIAAGNSPGTLTVDGDLSMDAAGGAEFEYGDQIVVTGDAVLDGTVSLTGDWSGFTGESIQLFDVTGSVTDNGVLVDTAGATGNDFSGWSFDAASGIYSIPEPATLGMIGLVLAGVLGWRRRMM